jgi:predicted phage terminase large subunit-like protein
VCTTWGWKDERFYLLDVLRGRLEYPELKRAVRRQADRFTPSVILIEDKASGTQLIQELHEEGLYAVTRYKPEGDKVMRMLAQTAAIENGFVYVPTTAPWLEEYLHELSLFPQAKYDDQADSTSQALGWTKQRPKGWAMYELARREHLERQHGIPADLITLKAPPGISHVQTITGRHLTVSDDGMVRVSQEEAASLYGARYVRC